MTLLESYLWLYNKTKVLSIYLDWERKVLNDRISVAFDRLVQIHQNMDYVHTLIMKYIKFKGDEADFLKFVEKDREKQEEKARENERKIK